MVVSVDVLTITGAGNHNEDEGKVTITVTRQATFDEVTVKISTIKDNTAAHTITAADLVMLTDVSKTFSVGMSKVTFDIQLTYDEVSAIMVCKPR